MDLGDFSLTETTETTAEPDHFDFYGDTFYLPPTVGAGVSLRLTAAFAESQARMQTAIALGKRASSDAEQNAANLEGLQSDMIADSAMFEFLQGVLGKDQHNRLLELVDLHGVTNIGLVTLCIKLQGAIGQRPTRRSTDSSAGPSPTGPSSTGGGSGSTAPPLTPRQQQVASFADASAGASPA